jgi:hypothetical protein
MEAALAAHYRHHTADAGRALCADDIQFPVARTLPLVATSTEIVGTIEDHRPQHGQQLFTARLVIMCFLAAGAGNFAVVRDWRRSQSLHRCSIGAVHRVPHQQIDGFQLNPTRLMPAIENNLEYAVYFLSDFLLDGFSRFFSAA